MSKREEISNICRVALTRLENEKVNEYIKDLQHQLEVSKTNEETYRLEMLDITKRLGLDKDTLFDEVKDRAEKLQAIIKEARKLCDYLLTNDEVIIKGKKYIKQECDDIITNAIKQILEKENK